MVRDDRLNVVLHPFFFRYLNQDRIKSMKPDHEMKFKTVAFYSFSLPKIVNDLIIIK